MDLSETTLRAALKSHPFRFFPATPSTQDTAFTWLEQGAPHGAVVISDHQTIGRGRKGRTWYTPPGTAIAVSMILRPQQTALWQTTMLGAVAVVNTLESIGLSDIKIKWPNDVLLHGRKVCGVLPEARWQGSELIGIVLGIGINVRVSFIGTELENTATSVEDWHGDRVDRSSLVSTLIKRIAFWLHRMDTSLLFDTWVSHLETLGKHITINGMSGIAESVDGEGALLFRDETGQTHRILTGEIL